MTEPVDTIQISDQQPTESPTPGLFSILDAETSAKFLRSSSRMTFDPGESLFLQESVHEYTFLIRSGLIRTYYVSEAGREVSLGYWSSGDTVGGPCLFGGGQHVWSAVASRRSEVHVITGAELRKLAESNLKVMNWIVKVLEFKLRWMSILLQIHVTEHVYDRLTKLLLMMADNYGEEIDGNIVIKHRISQTDLATMVGASRQWTNKALAKLRDEGVITMDKQRISLRNPNQLRKILVKV